MKENKLKIHSSKTNNAIYKQPMWDMVYFDNVKYHYVLSVKAS